MKRSKLHSRYKKQIKPHIYQCKTKALGKKYWVCVNMLFEKRKDGVRACGDSATEAYNNFMMLFYW